MWSFGAILVEIATGIPVGVHDKCKICMPDGKTTLGTGMFGAKAKIRISDGTVVEEQT